MATTSKPTTSKPTTSKPTTSAKGATSKPTTSKPTTSKPTTSAKGATAPAPVQATPATPATPAKVPAPYGTRGAPAGQGAAQAPVPASGPWATLVQAHPKLAAHAKAGSINSHYAALAAKPITLHALHAALATLPAYTSTARATNPNNLRTRVLQACTRYGVLVPVPNQPAGTLAPVPFAP